MQCDNCGKEVVVNQLGAIRKNAVWANAYGFVFCRINRESIFTESCEEAFERTLWERAKADKEAKRKAENKTQETGGSQAQMVGGSGEEWRSP